MKSNIANILKRLTVPFGASTTQPRVVIATDDPLLASLDLATPLSAGVVWYYGTDRGFVQAVIGDVDGGGEFQIGVKTHSDEHARPMRIFVDALTARMDMQLGAGCETLDLVASALSLNGNPVGGWLDFAPVWTATTTNPVLGSGTITGRWCRVGNMVTYTGRITMGADTTFGVGEWRISTPIPQAVGSIGSGSALIHDTSTPANKAPGSAWHVTSSTLGFYANGGPVSGTVPFAWAVGDQLRWTITYEVV